MEFPDWVLKFKQKNSELRCIRGKYYLYRISSIWDKEKKRARKVTGKMIGRITQQEGLIPSSGGRKKKVQSLEHKVSVKEYGASHTLLALAQEMTPQLKEHFPQEYARILSLALLRLMYSSPLKNMALLYEQSYLSEQFPGLDLSKNALTALFELLGKDRETIAQFMRGFIDGSTQLVFDTTHITSKSSLMKSALVGYNSQKDFDPQLNLFYVFSTDKQQPVYYRTFPGNITGMKALINCIKETGSAQVLAIGDKGFYSAENAQRLEEYGLRYIFPLKRDSRLIDYRPLHFRDYNQAFTGHFFYNNRVIFYYPVAVKEPELPANEKAATPFRKVVVFYDKSLAVEEENAYLRRIEDQVEGYDHQAYLSKQLKFGTIAMVTNQASLTAESIYHNYKARMEVETLFDTYKNLLMADKTYMQNEYSLEAWMFINHLSMMLYYRLYTLLKAQDKLQRLSPADLILQLSRISKLKIYDQWVTSEISQKTLALIKELELPVTCIPGS